MGSLMAIFESYAKGDGDNKTLSKSELKSMMEKELPELMKTAKNPEEVNKILGSLDAGGDSLVDFHEFMAFVCAMTCACYMLGIQHIPWSDFQQEEEAKHTAALCL
ncbi:protein S100-P-like [Diretmus argenteus]